MDGKLLKLIRSMYESIKCCVKHLNNLSDFFDSEMGLLQGEIMSPILFLFFLNDIELSFQENLLGGITLDQLSIYLLLFADDAVIMSETAEGLQVSLNQLEKYCDKWNLTVNVDKTKIVVFKKGGFRNRAIRFYYAGSEIEIVNQFNYLGMVLSSGGSFMNATNTFSSKAIRAMNSLFVNIKHMEVPIKIMFNLFDTLVTPVLSYACEIWGFSRAENCERVHRKFCKWILKVKVNTNNYALYGETGRFPLYIERYIKIIKYWFKISDENNTNCITKAVYIKLVADFESNINCKNWVSQVKSLLERSGFLEVWQYRTSVNVSSFIPLLRQRLRDLYINEWREGVSLHSSLSLYREFKQYFELASYLEKIVNPKFRKALSKLRLSSHNLNIEEGRYRNIGRNERYCTFCNKRDLEDEYHFILICPAYNEIRNKYIKQYYVKRPSMFKFIELLQSNNVNILKNLARFTLQAFEIRTSLYNSRDSD